MLNLQKSYEPDCGKVRYAGVKDARMGILLNWSSGNGFVVRSFYPCRICGGYHLTKKKPSAKCPSGNGRRI